jgi:transcriptional regulator with XRE-family HTH domain
VHIGERLKKERERLGISQTALGELASVGRKTQFNYETGERSPDAQYLAAIAAAGVDVRYVVTGERDRAQELAPDEMRLVALFRLAEESVRKAVLAALAAGDIPGKRRGPNQSQASNQVNVAPGGHVGNVVHSVHELNAPVYLPSPAPSKKPRKPKI